MVASDVLMSAQKLDSHDSGRSSSCEEHINVKSSGLIPSTKIKCNSAPRAVHNRVASAELPRRSEGKATKSGGLVGKRTERPDKLASSLIVSSRTPNQGPAANNRSTIHYNKKLASVGLASKHCSANLIEMRRAEVLERKRKQEQEAQAKMDQLRIERQRKCDRINTLKQIDKVARSANLTTKVSRNGSNHRSKHQGKTTSDQMKSTQGVAKQLPHHLQETINRLSTPKYRVGRVTCESDSHRRTQQAKQPTDRMAQSIHVSSLTKPQRTARHANTASIRNQSLSRSVNLVAKKAAASGDRVTRTLSTDSSNDMEQAYKQKLEEERQKALDKKAAERKKIEDEKKKREEEARRQEEEFERMHEESKRAESERLMAAIQESERLKAEQERLEEESRSKKAAIERERAERALKAEQQRQLDLEEHERQRQERRKKLDDMMNAHRSQVGDAASPLTASMEDATTTDSESISMLLNSDFISSETSEVVKSYLRRASSITMNTAAADVAPFASTQHTSEDS